MKYKTIQSNSGIYFVSTVITGHKSIFMDDNLAKIPLHSLKWFKDNGYWKLFAFCLMPNHLHFVVKLIKDIPIEKSLKEFHKFTGHEIVKYFRKTVIINC